MMDDTRLDNDWAQVHIALTVRNVERSTAFYEAFLGVPPHKQRPGYANFSVQQPPLKLALREGSVPQAGGALNHLGIVVASRQEVEAVRNRLIAAGLATFDQRDTGCCHARQDKVWVSDPDGNPWEVYVVLDDATEAPEESPGEGLRALGARGAIAEAECCATGSCG